MQSPKNLSLEIFKYSSLRQEFRIQSFASQVEDNLFTRPLGQYRTLGMELRKYEGKLESVKPLR